MTPDRLREERDHYCDIADLADALQIIIKQVMAKDAGR